MLLFQGDIYSIGRSILFAVLIIFMAMVIFAWFGSKAIPYTNLIVDNNFMIVLFTIVLTIATVINAIISRRTIGFSRLSELDFYLNKILAVVIENKGAYPVRKINMRMEIAEKRKGWEEMKERFISPERERFYLPSKERYAEKFGEYLEKKYPIQRDKNLDKYISQKEISFKVRIILRYSSDTFFKNPFPIVKLYKIKINSDGTTIREIDPFDYKK